MNPTGKPTSHEMPGTIPQEAANPSKEGSVGVGEQKIPPKKEEQPTKTQETKPVVTDKGVLPPAQNQEDSNQPALTKPPKKEITKAEAEVEVAKILDENPQDNEKLRQMAKEVGEIQL